MTVEQNRDAERLLYVAQGHRNMLETAEATARAATVEFMDAAIAANWSWRRIGDELGISDVGARTYYKRNRRRVRGGDRV